MFPYWTSIIVLTILTTLFELYKHYRQHKLYYIKEIPTDVKEVYGDSIEQKEFEKSQNYHLELSKVSFIRLTISFIINMYVLCSPILRIIWDFSTIYNQFLTSIIFIIIFDFISTIISIPFKLYTTFIIREKYGMNNMSLIVFIKDFIKSFILETILNLIIITLLYFVSETQNLALYLWFGIMTLNIIISLIFVPFVIPLFYKKTPLQEDQYKNEIESKLNEVNFPLKSVSVIDASSKAKEGNAFFSGLFGKRDLVLFDTLITTCSSDELVDIVLHEVGHCKHYHIFKLLGIQSIQFFIIFKFIEFFLLDEALYTQFGFDQKVVVVGFILLQSLLEPFMEIVSLGINFISRNFEYQADVYATKHGNHQLASALIKLQKNNLSAYVVDPFVSTIENSHPNLVERIQAINKIIKDMKSD
ncbi:CAAX prenyl protease, putative [Entamoeba histolytica HM-1:IMSS-B]|uniref:CAAX prenyl protease n=6 Tax=Entamoeba histolytica TaxID=5759 RepID=C4M998_ENTH1|nr:CAAX prenyl protease, putative [Entamoeba histolytica HM-1:IMSS]EMD45713.1 caax prenyl protease ste24, putative [Entamoeba histolytica KU27]EMH74692.1 CAAX prenyl protease, putative [Entamoeba histolytica HM-1:IMSS-B]EMS12894.1 caax prenyl protease ste24, putative [Entamoeba histolytica HM-3:IMSS]ENY61318.1 caax prenyl protease ste24, putative [Entamoeba histolytica HM-1:IMSS-A]GAT98221.1 CAAX prenyl protease putative [Entamoeba histolytica]|eukprot:XP_648770.1 CAAX prenyl protease, putative [Entamoeba histolytica HM-1:IMSS]